MAEDQNQSQEKTQDPSSRRLDKAAKDGKVISSKETYVFTILFAGVFLMYSTPYLVNDFLLAVKSFLQFGHEFREDNFSPIQPIKTAVSLFIKITIIFGAPLVLVCILTQFVVGGINFSLKPIEPKFEKLNILKGIQKIFSTKGLVELVKALLKVSFLGGITYIVLKKYLPEITYLTHPNLFSSLNRLLSFFPILLGALLIGLIIIAILDFMYAKFEFIKSLKMSHQDIKDEYKETDGQPEVKQKIRQLQIKASQRAAKENASIDNLSEATALITNPTHFAIALKYEVGESSAPIIIAKGKGRIAEKIINKAKKLNLGKLQSPVLARALYFTSEIGDEVVSKLYNSVAVALAYIYKVNEGEKINEPQIDVPEELIFDENGNKSV
ncbi:MAG: flagellar biosynthesis protein FlhB [Rickettsiales bacterium]|nr:flagellar biosynthesis protein FlhB [Rickettsiales bacterium]OUV53815.1 MAG: flagellar biosynthesis protein FlhB [Rickettsiales bacterium TMED127]